MNKLWICGAAALALAACATSRDYAAEADPPGNLMDPLVAEARDSAGRLLARASADQVGADLRLRVEAAGLSPGAYGTHIHAVGRCDPPGFTTAGPHWNPGNRQHGKDNPAGMHKGDLPNLLVGADGNGSFELTIANASLAGGAGDPLHDSDGAAIVIHAAPDDFRTDPSGNSGARIACGVFR